MTDPIPGEEHDRPHQDPTGHAPVPWYKHVWVWALVGLLVVAVLAGGVAMVRHSHTVREQQAAEAVKQAKARKEKEIRDAVLQRAYDGCIKTAEDDSSGYSDTLTLADEGKTLTLTSPANAFQAYDTYHCVAGQTRMPESVTGKIDQTNGFSGMQSDSWDNLKATWSYNGNSGLHLILERTK